MIPNKNANVIRKQDNKDFEKPSNHTFLVAEFDLDP